MADDRAVLLDVESEPVGAAIVVRARGEVDLTTAPLLDDAIVQAVATSPTAVIVDLSLVGFLASVGMNVLLTARRQAHADVELVVVADGPHTRRPLELVGLDSVIPIYPDLVAALAAVTQAEQDGIAEPA